MSMTSDQIRALNPTMAAIAIANQSPMTPAAQTVLEICCRNGGFVVAGRGSYRGRVERVSASVMRALARRGFLELCISSDGGQAGRLSRAALDRLNDVVGGSLATVSASTPTG
jgi:hypothetical protein